MTALPNLYVADLGNNRISLLTPIGLPAINPGLVVNPANSAACRQFLVHCIKLVLSGQPCSSRQASVA